MLLIISIMQALITLTLTPLLVFTAPKYDNKYVSKPYQLLKYRGGASYNILPEEDQMPSWNNPWTHNGGLMASLPLPPPPHDTFLMNNNPRHVEDLKMKMGYQNDLDDEDNQAMMKRSYMKMFRLFKKSFEDENSRDDKRNSVPMIG